MAAKAPYTYQSSKYYKSALYLYNQHQKLISLQSSHSWQQMQCAKDAKAELQYFCLLLYCKVVQVALFYSLEYYLSDHHLI